MYSINEQKEEKRDTGVLDKEKIEDNFIKKHNLGTCGATILR